MAAPPPASTGSALAGLAAVCASATEKHSGDVSDLLAALAAAERDEDRDDDDVATANEAEAEAETAERLTISCQFQSTVFPLELATDHSVLALKTLLSSLISVHPRRQKLIGLKLAVARADGRTAVMDDDLLSECALTRGQKLVVLGTREADLFVDPSELDPSLLPAVRDDFAGDFDLSHAVTVRDEAVTAALADVIANREIRLLSPLRPGKRLLVLDLDYTLLDTKSRDGDFRLAMRPFLHGFLELVHREFELVIWSQTRWTWLEMKLTDMGMLAAPGYRLLATLDVTHMFQVTSRLGSAAGEETTRTHFVKPLELLWARWPQFSAANTVHVDDLTRNFALNTQSGLKIRAYKNSAVTHADDLELAKLGAYLLSIVGQDFRELDHSKWRRVARRLRHAPSE